MGTTFRVAGISGSLRSGSYNTMLLNALEKLLPAGLYLETLSIELLPMYNGDIDIPAAAERPASVVNFRNALLKADGLIIVSPEYNYSIPGVLKNAIDWASRGDDSPMFKKPVALMGASDGLWGTARMQMAMQPIFMALEMHPVAPETMLSTAREKFDVSGALKDEGTKKIVHTQLTALHELLVKLHPERVYFQHQNL